MEATSLVQKCSVAILGTSLTLLGTSLSASATSLYSITEITVPGLEGISIDRISDNGQILGYGSKKIVTPLYPESITINSPFIWKNGKSNVLFDDLSDRVDFNLDVPQFQRVLDMNQSGTVVGSIGLSDVSLDGVIYGLGQSACYSWKEGKITIPSASCENSFLSKVSLNERGQTIEPIDAGGPSYYLYLTGEDGKGPGSVIRPLDPGACVSLPRSYDLNNLGQVAVTFDCDVAPSQSLFWNQGQSTSLGSLGGQNYSTRVQGINDSAQVIGSSNTANNETHGFSWKNGVMTDLGTLGGEFSSASAINEFGQIIGDSTTSSGESRGVTWKDGLITDLGTLGGGSSLAQQINATGQVLGCSTTSSGESNVFVWTGGVINDLGISGCDRNNDYIFNDRGQVLGKNSFFYDGKRTYSLQDIGELLGENSGWEISRITGLNNNGEIIGTGLFNGKKSVFVMKPDGEPVPEPSTIIGSVLALGSLATRTYRSRKRR